MGSSGRENIDFDVPDGLHYTAAQFSADTWAKLGKPRRPYDVGYAVREWINRIGLASAGTIYGWPVCWWGLP